MEVKTRTLVNIIAGGCLAIAVLLTVGVKYEEATHDSWIEAEVLRIRQKCMDNGGVWVITRNGRTEYCSHGGMGYGDPRR